MPKRFAIFPIQEAVIPVLLAGRDVVGQAHTGSGKTAAFALAMLQKIQPKNHENIERKKHFFPDHSKFFERKK